MSHTGNVPGSATITTMATVVTIEMMRSRRNAHREPRLARVAADSRMSAVATTMIDRTQAGVDLGRVVPEQDHRDQGGDADAR